MKSESTKQEKVLRTLAMSPPVGVAFREMLSTKAQSLVVEEGPHLGAKLTLDHDILHIGRGDWCDLVLADDRRVSSTHCKLSLTEDGVRIQDLSSRNGIFLEGHRIYDACLTSNCRLMVGESILALHIDSNLQELEVKHYDESGLLVGRSEKMRQIFALINRLSRRDIAVLLTGETGTGKTTVANAIHELSPRQGKPFVSVNCGALPASLIESSLFGYEKGAFTGATHQHKGFFEQAHGGTLFLDEIAELPLELQPKLLDVVERKQLRRLSGSADIQADFRLLTATHRDLKQEVEAGRFREDLYYRLAVVELEIPPLRERAEDVPLLAQRLLMDMSPEQLVELSPDALKTLQHYNWPGNVRQLRNALDRALAFMDESVITPETLMLPSMQESPAARGNKQDTLPYGTSLQVPGPGEKPIALKKVVAEMERDMIAATLEKTGWDINGTADLLQISRAWLYNRIKKYGINRD